MKGIYNIKKNIIRKHDEYVEATKNWNPIVAKVWMIICYIYMAISWSIVVAAFFYAAGKVLMRICESTYKAVDLILCSFRNVLLRMFGKFVSE